MSAVHIREHQRPGASRVGRLAVVLGVQAFHAIRGAAELGDVPAVVAAPAPGPPLGPVSLRTVSLPAADAGEADMARFAGRSPRAESDDVGPVRGVAAGTPVRAPPMRARALWGAPAAELVPLSRAAAELGPVVSGDRRRAASGDATPGRSRGVTGGRCCALVYAEDRALTEPVPVAVRTGAVFEAAPTPAYLLSLGALLGVVGFGCEHGPGP